MLRRATTKAHLPLLHRQRRSHLLSPCLRYPTHRYPFSRTSLSPSEEETGHDNPQNGLSSAPHQVEVEVEDDALREGTGHALSEDSARASDNDATLAHANSERTQTTRGRTRSLRPILIPPSFPPNLLLPIASIPETSSSSGQGPETDPSSVTTTITLTGLPPNTVKSDIRPVFHRFGEVQRIVVQPDIGHADVIFLDVDGVKRTLYAVAEQPLHVRGREVTVFRKKTQNENGGTEGNDESVADTDAASRATSAGQGDNRTIFVSGFPRNTTQEELSEVLEPLGKYERVIMRPNSKFAFFIYSSEDRVEQILRVHERVPITVQGQTILIEHAKKRTYNFPRGTSGQPLELEKPPDPATCSAILEEFTRTVPRFRASHEPTRVIWVGRLPTAISSTALTNFWSRLGCVVDLRTTSKGFAHIEFASVDEALRAMRQGAPHGFRYGQRLLDMDFAPWSFYIGPSYRVVYISMWPASSGRHGLSQWTYDVPNIVGTSVLPPFRGERRSGHRGAFLRFRTVDDAYVALRMLHGRVGPGGEVMRMGLSRPPLVHLERLWKWAYKVQDMGGEAYLEDEWEGLGFGTGTEEQDDNTQDVGDREWG